MIPQIDESSDAHSYSGEDSCPCSLCTYGGPWCAWCDETIDLKLDEWIYTRKKEKEICHVECAREIDHDCGSGCPCGCGNDDN